MSPTMKLTTSLNPPARPKSTDSAIALAEQDEQIPASAPSSGSKHMSVSEAILARHSSRLYLPRPVPRAHLTRALSLAQHAPSNTNTQPWRLFIVQDDALIRLNTALLAAAALSAPSIPPHPAPFAKYRAALGRTLYGDGWGLARDDAEGRREAVMRNFEFFGAPVGIVVCMSSDLVGTEAFSVGMYVQTLLLALTEVGVGSCVEISISGYAEVVREVVGIGEGLVVLCGIAVGFEDAGARVNRVQMGRDGVEESTVWVE
ncbi:oxidoreductase [Xylaria bambusicola]|uniref:oxidoreductase n=1 Tax=Xylaria bambusicola TaxID=326684 RepID=UPI0020088A7E|nr:oxidoreductase [Xylaria bambusicola]KAI0521233.1 oxidoreductase [Xylaria bambusicola]